MKTKHLLLALIVQLCSLPLLASVVTIDGIKYELQGWTKTATVVSGGSYSGDIIIPESFVYDGTPYSVTAIGGGAFRNCIGLTSVNIPKGVTSIGSDAFNGCSSLTSVTIPEGITSIEDGTFVCTGLTSVIIPKGVTSIGNNVFLDCSRLTSVTIPESVTSIGVGAFARTSLTSVTIPESVTSIEKWAFLSLDLQFVKILATTPPSIQADTFSHNKLLYVPHGCVSKYKGSNYWKNSFDSIIELSYVTIDHIEYIIDEVNSTAMLVDGKECSGNISIPEKIYVNGLDYLVTNISNNAFQGCSGLTSVVIPNSVTYIGDRAFDGCSGLTSVTISNSVTSIGNSAFSGCSSLTSVTIEDGTKTLSFPTSINTPFSDCPIKSLYLGRNLTYSSSYSPFMGIKSLTILTIGNSVTSIGGSAFSGCSGLTSVNIPNSVTSIGGYAFYGCSGLTSLTIPNSVTSIGSDAFNGCSGLTSVNIPNSVTSIGSEAFFRCSGLTSLTIPNSVTSIGYRAFFRCSGLTSVTISNSVRDIGQEVFAGCSGLTSVTIPNSVTSIDGGAFYGCSGLTSLTIPNSVTSIGYLAFFGCSGLTSMNFPNSVTSIGENAFQGCSGLTSVTISNSVRDIGQEAFAGCSGLTSVTIPNSVMEIGDMAFDGCSGLTSVTIEDGTNTLAFPKSSWKSSPPTPFSSCPITSLYLGRNISYSPSPFKGNTLLTSLTIGNSVTTIGNNAFSGCSGLTSLNIGNSVTTIGYAAFRYCSALTSVTIPNSITTIEYDAFQNCCGLTSVNIGNSVTSIGNNAFSGCDHVSTLTLNCEEIDNWFSDSKATVNTLTLGEGVKSVKASVFEDFSSLKTVVIPNSVTNIGEKAFKGCSAVTEIRIGEGIKEIKSQAFANCQKLEDVWCYAVKYPTTATDAFQDSYIDYVTLHVPTAGLKQYAATEPWSGFMQVVPIETPKPSDLTMSDAGYATYYDKYFDTVLPAGVKASIITQASDSKLTYKVIADGSSGGVVPAGTAVLLQGKQRKADTYTLTPKESTTTYTGENLLHGSDEATTTTADGDCVFYKLAYGPSGTALSNTLGWFWGADEGRPFEIEGHKAWLAIPKSASVKSRPLFYSIDGNAIELEDISLIHSQGEETSEGEWYDLQGRKLNVSAGETPALPGVYIRDGKKVFIK